MPYCVYCCQEKNSNEMSKEHVIPRSLGGNLSPTNPLVLDKVCKKCNGLCGLFIDAPFVRSWFNQNLRAVSAYKYIDIESSPILPLNYIGVLNNIYFEDKICEMWLGPTGDIAYHFHVPYPEEPDTPPLVGIPPHLRVNKIDLGFVFLFVYATNPTWHPIIIRSIVDQFDGSTLYLGNGPKPKENLFTDIPGELFDLHNTLKNLRGKEHSADIKMRIDYGDRFLSKVALGLGSLFLRDSFQSSDSAQKLRQFMWTKNLEKRQRLEMHMSNFLNVRVEPLKQVLTWPGGHIIYIMNLGNILALYLSIFETQLATIIISSESEHWEEIIGEDGLLFIISPGLQRFVGPIGFSDLLAHKNYPNHQHDDLLNLEHLMNQNKELPSYEL